MGNYKNIRDDRITLGGYEHLMKVNDLLLLMSKDSVTATNYSSIRDERDSSNYQVPAGKTARVVYVIREENGNTSDEIGYSDDENGSTNFVTLLKHLVTEIRTNFLYISNKVSAGKWFILHSIATSMTDYQFYILEEDA